MILWRHGEGDNDDDDDDEVDNSDDVEGRDNHYGVIYDHGSERHSDGRWSMGVTGIIMMMGNIKVIMKILILVDEITELMMIETMIAQEEVMIRSNGDCPRKRDNKCKY